MVKSALLEVFGNGHYGRHLAEHARELKKAQIKDWERYLADIEAIEEREKKRFARPFRQRIEHPILKKHGVKDFHELAVKSQKHLLVEARRTVKRLKKR